MTETLSTNQQEFTIGRAGMKIPVFDLEAHSSYGDFVQFDHFFEDLWKLNGFDYKLSYGQDYPDRTCNNELILPASGDKPLVTLRELREINYKPIGSPYEIKGQQIIPCDKSLQVQHDVLA